MVAYLGSGYPPIIDSFLSDVSQSLRWSLSFVLGWFTCPSVR